MFWKFLTAGRMANRNWDRLNPAYRKRLQGAGITKQQYESGASLQKARGHEQTPERPERAKPPEPGKPDKYKRYRDKIKRTIDYIQDFKRDKWGPPYVGVAPYNEKRSEMAVKKDPETGKMRGVKDLQVIKAMVDIAKTDTWLGWHGIVALAPGYENSMFYH
jgi:hypothetical protein